MKIAAHMTGMEFEAIDDTVKDGIGEICNMLAGAWKGKVPDLAANCGLSVPAVITGRDYNLHVQAPEFQLHHVYRFDEGASKSPSSATACNKTRKAAASQVTREVSGRSEAQAAQRCTPGTITRPLISLLLQF